MIITFLPIPQCGHSLLTDLINKAFPHAELKLTIFFLSTPIYAKTDVFCMTIPISPVFSKLTAAGCYSFPSAVHINKQWSVSEIWQEEKRPRGIFFAIVLGLQYISKNCFDDKV